MPYEFLVEVEICTTIAVLLIMSPIYILVLVRIGSVRVVHSAVCVSQLVDTAHSLYWLLERFRWCAFPENSAAQGVHRIGIVEFQRMIDLCLFIYVQSGF